MIKIFVIGFPHTATTYCYKYLLNKFKDYWGIFEPFNGEVVEWTLSSNITHHYSEGAVLHHLLNLSSSFKDLIRRNSEWFWNWIRYDFPTEPFLGRYYKIILHNLDEMKRNFIVKDVYAWVKLEEIVELLLNTNFILLVKDRKSVLNDFLMLYRHHKTQGNKAKLHGRWGLALSLFYRYFHGGNNYPKIINEKTITQLFNETYNQYLMKVSFVESHYKYRNRVHVIRFEKRLQDNQIEKIINRLFR